MLLDDKKSAATMIVKRIGSSASNDAGAPSSEQEDNSLEAQMKRMHEEEEGADHESMEVAPTNEDGDEIDSDMGIDTAIEEMMEAFSSQSTDRFKSALTSFLEMWMDKRR